MEPFDEVAAVEVMMSSRGHGQALQQKEKEHLASSISSPKELLSTNNTIPPPPRSIVLKLPHPATTGDARAAPVPFEEQENIAAEPPCPMKPLLPSSRQPHHQQLVRNGRHRNPNDAPVLRERDLVNSNKKSGAAAELQNAIKAQTTLWREKVRQKSLNDLNTQLRNVKGNSLQRSSSVREHGSSHQTAAALVEEERRMNNKKNALREVEEDMSEEEDDDDDEDMMKLRRTLPHVRAVRRSWKVKKSPSEERWEEAEERETMMMMMRSQSMRVDASSSGSGGVAEDEEEERGQQQWIFNNTRCGGGGFESGRRSLSGATAHATAAAMFRSMSMREAEQHQQGTIDGDWHRDLYHPSSYHHHHHHHHPYHASSSAPSSCCCCCCCHQHHQQQQQHPHCHHYGKSHHGGHKAKQSSTGNAVLRACRRLLGLSKKRQT